MTHGHGTGRRRLWILIGVLALVFAAVGAGCGGGDEEEAAPAPAEPAPAEPAEPPAEEPAPAEEPPAEEPPAEGVQTSGFEELGPVTLNLWVTSGPPDATGVQELVDKFTAQYPNVTVDIEYTSFGDTIKTAKLRLASPDAPCVMQGGQAYTIDAGLVENGLLVPLDDYAAAYGWTDIYDEEYLKQYQLTEDGAWGGGGLLYGVGHHVDTVGVFYNKEKLSALGYDAFPTTLAELEEMLAAAKAAGEVPLAYGNLDGLMGTWLFGTLWNHFGTSDEVRGWIFGEEGRTVDTPAVTQAADKFREWAEAGYFTEGYNGINLGDSVERFAGGEGVFNVQITGFTGTYAEKLGDSVGYENFPVGPDGNHEAVGSGSLPFHISTECDNPDLAAALIDTLVNEEAAPFLVEKGRIPTVLVEELPEGAPLLADTIEAWAEVKDGANLYTDWPTPDMLSVQTAATQELAAGEIATDEFISRLQENWDAFHSEGS